MSQKKPEAMPTIESELRRVQGVIERDEKKAEKDDTERLKEALNKEREKRRERDVNDMRQMLSRPECRRILHRIIEVSGAFTISFVPGKPDVTAHNEGQRVVGMFCMDLAESAEPGICLRMARESESDRVAQETRQRKLMAGED